MFTLMEVHMLLQGVFGAERFGADRTNKRLLSGVNPLVNQESVLLGKTLPTHWAPERFLTWCKRKRRFMQLDSLDTLC